MKDEICEWTRSKKLQIKSRKYPEYSENLLSHVTQKIKNRVDQIVMPKYKTNLTLLEAKGHRWCKKVVRERKLYITKVDKGGCIIILDASDVDNLMRESLSDESSFEKINKDPCDVIKKNIKKILLKYEKKNLLTQDDIFDITGITKKGGVSHGREFIVRKPYMYPLFKIHKLNSDQIAAKVIPPTRMVTSGVGGPTYRLGIFLDNLLKPVVERYCKNELVRDTTSFLKKLKSIEETGNSRQMKLVGTLDVDALYPSIRLDIALQAIIHALVFSTDYSSEQIDMIIELTELCIRNSVICYRGSWYRTTVGIPTGGPESGSIANLVVYFVLETILLPNPKIKGLNRMLDRSRFLDDLWFGWGGTERQFAVFKTALNEIGSTVGITFKGEVGASVDFLDVTVELTKDSLFKTKLYTKPTDASRYLHRRSDHGLHTFRSIPFSQFRRAVVLCSDSHERDESIKYISRKLLDSGYNEKEIENAKLKAMQLDRRKILGSPSTPKAEEDKKQIIFTINHDRYMNKQIKEILSDNQNEINELLGGSTRLIVAERRNMNIASSLFAKSAFSKVETKMKEDQKCKSRGCMSCSLMNIEKTITLWKDHPNEVIVNLDCKCDCSSENIVYLFVCKLCPNNMSFYVGQSINSCRTRANGHRAKFNLKSYTKSALSVHMYKDHPHFFDNKLQNYDLGILKSSNPLNLDRCEDYYLELTKAHISLNRYKVTQ